MAWECQLDDSPVCKPLGYKISSSLFALLWKEIYWLLDDSFHVNYLSQHNIICHTKLYLVTQKYDLSHQNMACYTKIWPFITKYDFLYSYKPDSRCQLNFSLSPLLCEIKHTAWSWPTGRYYFSVLAYKLPQLKLPVCLMMQPLLGLYLILES